MKRSWLSVALRAGASLLGMWLVCGVVVRPLPAVAQGVFSAVTAQCGVGGYRVVATRWDVVLGTGWELRQSCAHPEWPTRAVAVGRRVLSAVAQNGLPIRTGVAPPVQPFLVHAGERVRLWAQDAMVRIEMGGMAEQSARSGESVMVQVTRQNDGAGTTVESVKGTVRGVGDVEMEP